MDSSQSMLQNSGKKRKQSQKKVIADPVKYRQNLIERFK